MVGRQINFFILDGLKSHCDDCPFKLNSDYHHQQPSRKHTGTSSRKRFENKNLTDTSACLKGTQQ